jgi:DNA-binding response OmpR family regulator
MEDDGTTLIVVVDDSDDIRDLYELGLRSAGYRVIGCADAESAFEVTRSERPDLVITDIGLGVTSGLDLITRIRSDLAPPLPQIIACSGFPDFEQQALSRGAHCFLPKPFDFAALRTAVSEALAGKPLSPPTAARATGRARELRHEAIVAADSALSNLAGEMRRDYEQRCEWTSAWLPRYFGFGKASFVLIEEGQLRVVAGTTPRFPKGTVLGDRAPLCRDVVETSSTLVLPDASRWVDFGIGVVRFFCGVPITNGDVAIGAVLLVADEPHAFASEDLALVESFARINSAILALSPVRPTAVDADMAPFWSPTGLISRQGLRRLLVLELKRSERTCAPLFVLAFETTGDAWRQEVTARLTSPRSALAELGGERYAVALVPTSTEEALATLADVVRIVRLRSGLRGAGLVSLAGGNIAMRTGDDLIWLAEELCARAVRRGGEEIESVVVNHEPVQLETRAPAP